MVVQWQGKAQRQIIKHLVMSTSLRTCSSSGAARGSSTASLLELLREGVLIILLQLSTVKVLSEPACLLEMLLLLRQRQDGLIHLQSTLSEGKVALSDQLLAPLVVAVDVEVFLCDHMNDILQGILVHADWCRVQSMNLQYLTLAILDLQYVHCIMFGVQTGVGGPERHELSRQWCLLALSERVGHTGISKLLQMMTVVVAAGSTGALCTRVSRMSRARRWLPYLVC